jgi:hypothetical protein
MGRATISITYDAESPKSAPALFKFSHKKRENRDMAMQLPVASIVTSSVARARAKGFQRCMPHVDLAHMPKLHLFDRLHRKTRLGESP